MLKPVQNHALECSELPRHPVDIGVDPQKSAWVELSISSQIGSLCLSETDAKLNLEFTQVLSRGT